jgi:hypothetical protein
MRLALARATEEEIVDFDGIAEEKVDKHLQRNTMMA